MITPMSTHARCRVRGAGRPAVVALVVLAALTAACGGAPPAAPAQPVSVEPIEPADGDPAETPAVDADPAHRAEQDALACYQTCVMNTEGGVDEIDAICNDQCGLE